MLGTSKNEIMNYEKEYKEAFERARTIHNEHRAQCADVMVKVFPELCESEDEKIRKELIAFLNHYHTGQGKTVVYDNDWISWLEKQGSQKSIEKVEPKFKVGDWVVHDMSDGRKVIRQIVNMTNKSYVLDGEDFNTFYFNDLENDYHLWSIQDAKDGDVLSAEKQPFIYNGKFTELKVGAYCGLDYLGNFVVSQYSQKCNWACNENIRHTTEEQRDLLFQKMKEAGYEWDAEKKELKNIPNALEECEIEHIEHGKYYYCIKDYYTGGNKRVSKGEVVQALRGMSMMALGVKANEYFIPVKCIVDARHAWSEEDERIYQSIMDDTLQENQLNGEQTNWLKDIKYRYFPQPKQERSEGMYNSKTICNNCEDKDYCSQSEYVKNNCYKLK
jgi:hypothetical protein